MVGGESCEHKWIGIEIGQFPKFLLAVWWCRNFEKLSNWLFFLCLYVRDFHSAFLIWLCTNMNVCRGVLKLGGEMDEVVKSLESMPSNPPLGGGNPPLDGAKQTWSRREPRMG